MTQRRHHLYIFIAILGVYIGSMFWASARSSFDQDAQARKAEYLFFEAQSAYADSKYDKYIKLIERAYKLDSTDIDIAGEWALISLMDENSDSASIEKAYQLLKRRYESDPSNYSSGMIAASVAQDRMKYADAVRIWEMLDSAFPKRPDIPLDLAKAYLRAYMWGDSTAFDKAMSIYNRLEEGAGRSIDLTSQKINAFYVKNDTLSVINELDSLFAHASNDSYTALYIGANYQYLNMPDSAIVYYNLACDLDSTNGSAYLQRAKFYNAQNDSVGFDREVFLALKSQNLDVESKIGILRSYVSELYTDSLQEPRIRQLFNELETMHVGEPEIHGLYGAYLYERDDYSGAAEQFGYVTALSPSDESAWTSYIQTSAMANDTTTVINAGKEAMSRFPNNLLFPIIIANVYRLNNNNEKAIEVLEEVNIDEIKNYNAVSNFLTSKGDAYASAGDTIKALEIYDRAIEINPDNSMALNNAAYFITLTGGDLDKAEKYSARSLVGDELNPTYLDTYAWVFFNKKDYQMAKQYIDIALNAFRTAALDDEGQESEDSVKEQESDDTEATIDINVTEDEDIDGESAEIYDHAGDIYFMNGENIQAIEFWKKAHDLDPDDEIINKKLKHKTIFLR